MLAQPLIFGRRRNVSGFDGTENKLMVFLMDCTADRVADESKLTARYLFDKVACVDREKARKKELAAQKNATEDRACHYIFHGQPH